MSILNIAKIHLLQCWDIFIRTCIFGAQFFRHSNLAEMYLSSHNTVLGHGDILQMH